MALLLGAPDEESPDDNGGPLSPDDTLVEPLDPRLDEPDDDGELTPDDDKSTEDEPPLLELKSEELTDGALLLGGGALADGAELEGPLLDGGSDEEELPLPPLLEAGAELDAPELPLELGPDELDDGALLPGGGTLADGAELDGPLLEYELDDEPEELDEPDEDPLDDEPTDPLDELEQHSQQQQPAWWLKVHTPSERVSVAPDRQIDTGRV